MAKVLEFPVKKKLTPEIEDVINLVASAYVEILNYALNELSSEDPTTEELNEIRGLVEISYLKGLVKAIDKMEEL